MSAFCIYVTKRASEIYVAPILYKCARKAENETEEMVFYKAVKAADKLH